MAKLTHLSRQKIISERASLSADANTNTNMPGFMRKIVFINTFCWLGLIPARTLQGLGRLWEDLWTIGSLLLVNITVDFMNQFWP
jgi:hypothetical protein